PRERRAACATRSSGTRAAARVPACAPTGRRVCPARCAHSSLRLDRRPRRSTAMNFPPIDVAGSGDLDARLHTTLGNSVVRLEESKVPKTVANFVGLATGKIEWSDPKTDEKMTGKPLYDGVRFHRVIPEFMIQCGDPLTRHTDMASRWGTGGPGY